MHISLLVEVQAHPKHKQKAVFLMAQKTPNLSAFQRCASSDCHGWCMEAHQVNWERIFMRRTIIIEIKCKQIRCQEVSLMCCWCHPKCLYWCWSCHLNKGYKVEILGRCILFCMVSRVLPHWATGDDTFRAMFTNDSKLSSVVINIHVSRLTSQNGKMWTSWIIPYVCLQWFWI